MFLSLNEAELSEVVKTWNSGFSDYIVPVNMDIESFNKRNNMLNISYEDSTVYVEDGIYKAVILVGYRNFKEEYHAWIGGMSVIKEYRNQKIAYKMLKYIEEKIKIKNCNKILLECISSNLRAKNLYEIFGFKIIDELSFSNIEIDKNIKIDRNIEFIKNNRDLKVYESPLISYQNRIKNNNDLKIIVINNKQYGYIYYEKIYRDSEVSEIIIRQINEFEKFNLNIIKDIIAKLHFDYKFAEIKLVNFNKGNEIYKLLEEYGLRESLYQYEMEKNLL